MDKRDVLRQAVEAMAAAIQYKFSKKKKQCPSLFSI
jgi:hypothetical protein